jgi:type I restriction enzyme S subunit
MSVPKLRFKAFIKPYKNIKYEEFAPLQRGFDLPVSTIVDGEYPVVFSNGILKKHNSFKAKAPGVVTGRSGTIGNITWVDKDYWPHNTSLWVTNFFDNDPRYTFYFLQDFDVSRFASGSGVPTLNRNDVHAQLIHIPTDRNEQSKIATFLSAVDEKITQLTQKHQLLSQYKQGMMQKLFSQQIRFKADDGSEFGEWDEYSLDTLLSKIIDNRGKTPVTEANLEIPLIEVNAIGQRRIKYEKVSKYFSEDTFQNWFRAYLEHQDILFSTVGNTAICSIYTDEIKAGIAQNIVGLRANTKLIQPTFLYYLLTEISNNQKFKSIEMQAVQPSIKVSQMIHLTFLTPCLEEQTKIANFLSTIDQKIEVTEQQIEQAKQWKKGLLQQMFV